MRQSFKWMAVIAVFAMVFAACGGAASPSPSAASPQASPSEAASPSPAGPSASPSPTGPPVKIRWFCCLGTGDAPELVKVEKKVVDDFNKSQQHVKLEIEVVAYDGARAALSTEIGAGNAPDIVGPVGVGGAEAFHGQWLDLTDLIKNNNYDLNQYSTGSVDFYKISGEGQQAIPFAIYPSFLWYQKDMFEEAGLDEPPHKYGDKYKMPDGSEVDWNYDTIKKIGLLLTVDKNGKDATDPAFDPKHIVQYGFEPQRDDARGWGAFFGAGQLAGGADGKTVQIPQPWQDAWKWAYDGMWNNTSKFIMTGPVFNSNEFNGGGYSFCSGKVAMQVNFLWSKYCLVPEKPGAKAPAGSNWDIATAPSNNGKVTAVFNADTFRIMKQSKHPQEAFEALTYLLGQGSTELLNAYGGMPARSADQDQFFTAINKDFPQNPDWQVAKDSVQYADNPNFEAYMPAYNESLDRIGTFWTKLTATAGVNVDAEITKLQTDLQAIWNKKK
jgi:multiple sugar transport system substrate-binding protein